MSILTKQNDRIEKLARLLDDEVAKLVEAPGIETGREVCMKARKLYTGFEQESIWREAVDEDERVTALESLISATQSLDEIGGDINDQDRFKYIKIMVAMSERITLVRHATFSTIKDYLREFSAQITSSD